MMAPTEYSTTVPVPARVRKVGKSKANSATNSLTNGHVSSSRASLDLS